MCIVDLWVSRRLLLLHSVLKTEFTCCNRESFSAGSRSGSRHVYHRCCAAGVMVNSNATIESGGCPVRRRNRGMRVRLLAALSIRYI
jgi:hypothetical protein